MAGLVEFSSSEGIRNSSFGFGCVGLSSLFLLFLHLSVTWKRRCNGSF